MKAKLIILENPVIVTDEEIKVGDWYFYGNRFDIKELNQFKKGIDDTTFLKEMGILKIISTNKPIDYNGIDFGIVDVEKLASELLLNGNAHRRGFIEGFKAAQQLNEKKFSEADLRNYRKMYQIELEAQSNSFREQDRNSLTAFEILTENTHREVMKQLSLPKTFEVEIEETPTNIKILKKL